MSDEYEWGPWVEHDGKGRPVPVGTFVLVYIPFWGEFEALAGCYNGGKTEIHGGENSKDSHWVWSIENLYFGIVRYRIRKPRALTELRQMVESLPAKPAPEKELT